MSANPERARRRPAMTHLPPHLGIAAASAGWKAGHAAVRSGALTLDSVDEGARDALLTAYATNQAHHYMREMVERHGLTPAQGGRLFMAYAQIFARGALDQALDGGALLPGD